MQNIPHNWDKLWKRGVQMWIYLGKCESNETKLSRFNYKINPESVKFGADLAKLKIVCSCITMTGEVPKTGIIIKVSIRKIKTRRFLISPKNVEKTSRLCRKPESNERTTCMHLLKLTEYRKKFTKVSAL